MLSKKKKHLLTYTASIQQKDFQEMGKRYKNPSLKNISATIMLQRGKEMGEEKDFHFRIQFPV